MGHGASGPILRAPAELASSSRDKASRLREDEPSVLWRVVQLCLIHRDEGGGDGPAGDCGPWR